MGASGTARSLGGRGREGRRQQMKRVVHLLDEAYGRPALTPRLPPLDELIYTVLSQNTADVNTDRAFAALRRRFPAWSAVRDAPVEDVVEAIRPGGLAATKGPRIKTILTAVGSPREGAEPDLGALDGLDDDAAGAWLEALPGVGPKTTACVLLFSLGRPVMPVDTHVHRVARRLGLIDAGTTAEQAHPVLTDLAGPEAAQIYAAHVGLVRHGRRVCHARRPCCGDCVLARLCPSADVG